jgi:uncharacterized protein (TIGR03000 family)
LRSAARARAGRVAAARVLPGFTRNARGYSYRTVSSATWGNFGGWWPGRLGLRFGWGWWPSWAGYGWGWPTYAYGYGYPDAGIGPGLPGLEDGVDSYVPPDVEERNLPAPLRGRLRVIVPPNAVVWVAGERTTLTGPARDFLTPPLTPGRDYVYRVRARWMTESGPTEEMREVRIRANQTSEVDFTAPPVETLRTRPRQR